MKNHSSAFARWSALGLATGGLFLGAVPALSTRGSTPDVVPVRAADAKSAVQAGGRAAAGFAPVVKRVLPAVVKVFSTARAADPRNDPPLDPLLRRFFGDDAPPGARRMPAPRQQGLGSGVVVSEDGYILTNNHVVDGADTVKVQLADERQFVAKVVGKDPKTDLAVLKVQAKGLPRLELADSDVSEVGDLVLAVGNPFGIGQTVTTGIVSAKGRATLGLDYEDFIQTDAAINPGNSGGALVDTEGRLLGINTAILSRSGGNQGIGFAIPANLARDVMDALIKDGKVARGYLGVHIQDVGPAIAKRLDLGDARGALVADVSPRGPAAKAGVEDGDVVVEFDGKPVRDSRQLRLAVARVRPGTTVPLKLLRGGDPRTIQVTVRELDGEGGAVAGKPARPEKDGDTLDGVGVVDLDARNRREHGIPREVEGALVSEVDPDSPSYEAGLRAGDVIVELNRARVKGADDAVRMTARPSDRTTLVKVWRRGGNRYLVIDESGSGGD